MTKIEEIRHSLAHLLAMAVLEKFPKAELGIGPTIENGFYYDFAFKIADTRGSKKTRINADKISINQHKSAIAEGDLAEIERRMRELIKKDLQFEKEKISSREAEKLFKNQPYKLELIKELEKEKKTITIYRTCPSKIENLKLKIENCFIDLCAGPHIKSTKEINPDAFKLIKIAGAYWRGNERNQMLTRIYGLAFNTKKELDEYLKLQEEAEKRDHRKIGKELDLFSFHEEGPGFPFWHPKGMIIYNELVNFIARENEKRGYGEVKTPPILRKNLWITSGHWEKFKENMYFTEIEGEEFAIKPMNCPGGLLIYKENLHSYRDLPLRYSEFGLVHRHELSGVLHGLFRVRSFTQDDAHVFCAAEQLNKEIIQMVDYALDVYKTFGFDKYEIFIATKPEKYIGDDRTWEKATDALEESLKSKKIKYGIKEGEGAFYGPKIEFNIKDALGRNWQLGTIQVDFAMPARFDAFYIDKDGEKQNPVMVHRAILGSLERFIGILLEHYAGALPVWLSPVQVKIIPVSEKFNAYGEEVLAEMKNNNIRAEIDNGNETLGKRIRTAELQKIPYILVVGEKEEKSSSVAVRSRKGDKGAMQLEKFLEKIKYEITHSNIKIPHCFSMGLDK
jgi:threonyl-tRNA synthetase